MKADKRILYLVRHAKSGKGTIEISDIDRTLNETGVAEAYEMAERLFDMKEIPQLIITSSATRAASTALIFQRVLQVPFERFKVTEALYEMDVNDLYEFVADLDDRYHSVMIIGHNPSISLFSAKMDAAVMHVPTAGVIRFDFEVEKWRHSSYINAEQKIFMAP
mgnify:FL=1|jgi:phosphohistidine phosphatase